MRLKTCKVCKKKFTPDRSFQTTCDFTCAIEYSKTLSKKMNRSALKQFNNSDVAVLKRKAQEVFNKWIRLRDGKVCISCGYKGDGRQMHAGHYRSQGGNSALRFDELNVHAQCSICNNHLSGNLANYRMNLIEKIGLEAVQKLETDKATKRWTVEELKAIIEKYKKKIKEKYV